MIKAALLDGFKLTCNDKPVALQPMQAALVTVLWCLGRSAETDQLADALWEVPAQRSGDARRARRDQVRVHVSRTRKAIASAAGPAQDAVIVTGQPGAGRTLYQLTRAIQFDADQFLALTHQGLRALARGAHQHAADILTAALDLWGPVTAPDQVLTAVAGRPATEQAIGRLHDARRDAITGLGRAEISTGLPGKAAGDLNRLARDWPDDLEIAYLHATALYRSGQPAAASQVARQMIITAHQAGINDQAYHHLQKAILDGTLPRRGPIPA
jgi:DNA-binding SARP family transcriptional activator